MELKISQFAKWFATFMAVYFSFLVTDEFLRTSQKVEKFSSKFIIETEFSDRIIKDYYLKTDNDFEIGVNKIVYESIKKGDSLLLFISPIFRQLKGTTVHLKNGYMYSTAEEINDLRMPHLFTSIPVVVLCVLSAFVVKRFELRVAFFFFACLIAAVRWWFLGI